MSVPIPDNPDARPLHDEVDLLEIDETVPPRPEEEVADVARSAPDRYGHGGAGVPRWYQVEEASESAHVDPDESTEPVAPSADDPRP